jgi:uncharacterized protein (UPF0332 family)
MTFDPLLFLDLAEAMDCDTEAQVRTVINRSYYAVFLRARDNLDDQGLISKSNLGDDHGKVIRALKSHKRVTAGMQLDDLREMRRDADYETDLSISSDQASKALILACSVKGALSQDWGIPQQ